MWITFLRKKISRYTVFPALLFIMSACSEIDSVIGNFFPEEIDERVEGTPSKKGTQKAQYAEWQDIPFVYRLQAGDEISVQHPHAKELNQRVKILPDGRIYLPLVGGVVASDLSPSELSAILIKSYSAELHNPVVSVIPKKIGSQKVYVGGEVENPGVYEFTGPLGVVEAIFSAGGLLNTANGREVVVLRRTPDNRAMMRTVNTSSILKGIRKRPNLRLRQYDVVFIPKTAAAEIGTWVEQNITNILPFGRSFSYTVQKSVTGGL
jgi:polysaccharide biosynthesis/export protein PslD